MVIFSAPAKLLRLDLFSTSDYLSRNMKIKNPIINSLSKHLFWDVDASKLDTEKNRKLVIRRVLAYGTLSDWELIYNRYGIDEIAKIAQSIKDLDFKSASFVSMLSGIPKEKFSCYTTKRLTQLHWVS